MRVCTTNNCTVLLKTVQSAAETEFCFSSEPAGGPTHPPLTLAHLELKAILFSDVVKNQHSVLGRSMAQWSALSPHYKGVQGLIPDLDLCGVKLFFSCFCGVSPLPPTVQNML